jgi:hypothetical protein
VAPIKFQRRYPPCNGGHNSPNNEHPNGNKYGLSDLRENYSIIFRDGGGDQTTQARNPATLRNIRAVINRCPTLMLPCDPRRLSYDLQRSLVDPFGNAFRHTLIRTSLRPCKAMRSSTVNLPSPAQRGVVSFGGGGGGGGRRVCLSAKIEYNYIDFRNESYVFPFNVNLGCV